MKMQGMTLVELLITLCIICMLSFLALGSLGYFISANEEDSIKDTIKTIVQVARVKALQTGGVVYLAPLDKKVGWSKGIVLVQIDKKTQSKKVLQQWQWQYPKWNLAWSGTRPFNYIQFSSNPANAISNGRFTITQADTQAKVIMVLNRLGRLKIMRSRSTEQ